MISMYISISIHVNAWYQQSISIMVSKNLPMGVKIGMPINLLVFGGYLKVREFL